MKKIKIDKPTALQRVLYQGIDLYQHPGDPNVTPYVKPMDMIKILKRLKAFPNHTCGGIEVWSPFGYEEFLIDANQLYEFQDPAIYYCNFTVFGPDGDGDLS